MNEPCSFGGCDMPASAFCVWGNYPNGDHNQHPLCDAHREEVWNACKDGVMAGITHFQIMADLLRGGSAIDPGPGRADRRAE